MVELQKAGSRREQFGLAIAALGALKRHGRVWDVQSQSGSKRYKVRPYRRIPQCTCADFRDRGGRCKHIVAVQAMILPDGFPKPPVLDAANGEDIRVRPTYPQVWPAYNAAQTNEKHEFQHLLAELCKLVPPQAPSKGRPPILLSDAIFAATYKVYTRFPARRFACDLKDAEARGHITKAPHFNSVLNYLRMPTVAQNLRDLIVASSRPFVDLEEVIATDSTGFTASRFARWREKRQWGKAREEHMWVKAHIACGVRSNVITAIEIKERDTSDTIVLPDLIRTTNKTGFHIREVVADKGYSSVHNLEFIDRMGAEPYIPFKTIHTGRRGGLWEKLFHFFHANREEFDRHYHKRSNVETTMAMIKTKFGDGVRSKTDAAMTNEVYCKALSHNICCVIQAMHELGMKPEFGIPGASERMRHSPTSERRYQS